MTKVYFKNLALDEQSRLHNWLLAEMPQKTQHKWTLTSILNPHTFNNEVCIAFDKEEDAMWFNLRWL
jgi:hypothetical protein